MRRTGSGPQSASISHPDYWWYRARAELLHAALGDHLGDPELVLDVGSADGPSVSWMRTSGRRVSVDVDPRGLEPGQGVRASALALPFRDRTFDVVSAFDVLEHCASEDQALNELRRVLVPGGRLLLSVPAYQWAWTDHDVRAGHHRRYTRPRLLGAVRRAGLTVERCTYGFAGVFPLFVAERASRRLRGRRAAPDERTTLPRLPDRLESALVAVSRVEASWLRRLDLPFGSSVFLAARRRTR